MFYFDETYHRSDNKMCRITSKLKTEKVVLVCILILAACLRFYGLNWDQGYHLHPDERWITMVAEKISLPQNLDEFLTADSPLNPKFFAYGSLPIYLLKFAGNLAGFLTPELAQYGSLNLLGRIISVFFDLGTLVLVFLLGRKIWNEKVGLLASFFYAIAVFPIQNAHFYTVDTQLTFWVMLILWLIVQKKLVPVGVAFGAALATKITAVFLLPSILLAVLMKVGSLRLLRSLRTSIYSLMFIFGAALFTFILLQPYALIDFPRFKSDILLQSQMSRDATVFPYTIQYVDTGPYVYQLKNLVLWGLGMPLGALGILGVLGVTIQTCRQFLTVRYKKENYQLFLLSFFWTYFTVIGVSSVKFMRYLLPLYPLLVLSAAYLFHYFWTKKFKFALMKHIIEVGLVGLSIVYTLSFVSIYARPHTRITASSWINQNIPAGNTLATEHWDDELPLWGGEKYQRVKLNLYDPDNAIKVDELVNKIAQADYIILSSNRLYDSIPKLPDNYPTTIRYYELLFAEELGFEKVVEFASYPNLRFTIYDLRFDDSSADESFTVYDHPKVMIFKKTKRVNAETLRTFLTEF